jgi:L-fuculose-phosphate aldolase
MENDMRQKYGCQSETAILSATEEELIADEIDRRYMERKLVFYGKLLYRNGYVRGTSGNLSVRLGRKNVLITPSGFSKGFLRNNDSVVVCLDGKKVAGSNKPSIELGIHLSIYKLRPDINAVVHAHPCIATGFASAATALSELLCPELALTLGSVPLAAYAPPGSEALVKAVEPFVRDHNAILLENHGVVTYGKTIEQAYLNMETLEHCAKIVLVSKLLTHCSVKRAT